MQPEILILERDDLRREGLLQMLRETPFRFLTVDAQQVQELLQTDSVQLLIIGADDLSILDDLPREGGFVTVPVLALIDPGNHSAILGCLSTGVRGTISRDKSSDDILAKIKALMSHSDLNHSDPHQISIDGDGLLQEKLYRKEDLIEVIQSSCEEIRRLREQYEEELSQRRKVEQALMESEAFYQSLVETLPMAMFRKDWSGRITFANRLMCTALKKPLEGVIGRTDYDFFPREMAKKYRDDDRRVLETQVDFETTEEFQSPTGEHRYTHVMKTPVYDANGTVVGIQGIFSDVTEKERAEHELQHTKSRLQAILDAATRVSIIATDANGLIEVFNAGAERMLGYTAEEMVGKHTPAIIHLESEVIRRGEEMSRELGRPIRGFDVFVEYARQGQYDESDWTYVRKDGSTLTVSLVVTARRDRDGTPNGFLGIASDVSSRKRAEEQMRKAKEAAESANKAKSDFLANMSHEIRTPLNAIIGMTELVQDTDLNTSQREYLSMVQESGEVLLAVINDILDFSKIEAGKLTLESVAFNARDVLGDTMKSLALRAHRKQLELSCHIAPNVPHFIVGDSNRLRQIVINLVGNAIKFTEAGEVNLDIALQTESDSDLILHFRVQDTGIGIPQEKLDTIFEAFEQADTSTTRKYGGTGLGLAIVSRLVELMHGNIWVDSEINRGSTFHFTARFGKPDTASVDISNVDVYPPVLQDMKVLIVDDNATNRRILTEMLTNWGMQPLAVIGVDEAIQELEKMAAKGSPYTLILTDSNMPGKDGFTLAKLVQQNRSLVESVIMMLTSGDRPEDKQKCTDLGVASYLIKPIKQSELLDAIVFAVGASPTRASISKSTPTTRHQATIPKSILLAEDSVINQRLAIGLLERWGHRVTVANNGQEAVKLSSKGGFDLILMDIQMPELDGLDATRIIRNREKGTGKHIPILAMTAHAMKGDRERCLESGMDGYLTKPIRAESLFRHIEEIEASNSIEEAEQRQQRDATPDRLESTPPTAETQHASVIDWKLARRAVNGDEELLEQVLKAFSEEGPQLFESMKSAQAAGEWKRFQRAAHTLKSALRTFGIAAADRVEAMELSVKSGISTINTAQLDEIAAEIQPAFREIARHLKG